MPKDFFRTALSNPDVIPPHVLQLASRSFQGPFKPKGMICSVVSVLETARQYMHCPTVPKVLSGIFSVPIDYRSIIVFPRKIIARM